MFETVDTLLCNTPAQDLLTINEMRAYLEEQGAYLEEQALPDDFANRVAHSFEFRALSMSPKVYYGHSSPHPVTDLLSWNEQEAYLATGTFPADFADRVRSILADDICTNCDGVRNMSIRLRDWWGEDGGDDCPFCCGEPT